MKQTVAKVDPNSDRVAINWLLLNEYTKISNISFILKEVIFRALAIKFNKTSPAYPIKHNTIICFFERCTTYFSQTINRPNKKTIASPLPPQDIITTL